MKKRDHFVVRYILNGQQIQEDVHGLKALKSLKSVLECKNIPYSIDES